MSKPVRGYGFRVFMSYVGALAAVGLSLFLRDQMQPLLGDRFPLVMVLLAAVASAWFFGTGPGLVGLVLGTTVGTLMFLPPDDPAGVLAPASQISLALSLILGLVSILAVESLRRVSNRAGQQREWLEVSLGSIADAVITTGFDGRVAFMNPAAESLSGWTSAEAMGRPLDELFTIARDESSAAHGLPLLATRPSEVQLPEGAILVTKSGGRVPVEGMVSTIRGPSGERRGTMLVLRDVAQRRVADHARRRLASIVESTEDGVISKNLDGIITSWNAGAEQLYGYTAQEATGQHISMIVPLDRHVELTQVMARLTTGESIEHYETVRQHKDGRRIDVSVRISPIRDSEGRTTGASVIARDISRQKKTERALGESESRTRAIVDAALDCIVSIDYAGRIVEFNPAAEQMFGYRRSDVLGQLMAELIIPPSYRAQHYAGLRRFIETGEGRILDRLVELEALRADGTLFPVEASISSIGSTAEPMFTAYLRDITDRRQIERRRNTRLAVAQILIESPTLADAVRRVLQSVCEGLGWDAGEFCAPDESGTHLRCLHIWHKAEVHVEEFAALSRRFQFPMGVGLPGRIWESGKPAWIPDVSTDSNFPRGQVAAREGLHGAFGCPIVLDGKVIAVMDFYSHDVRQPNDDLLETMVTLCAQIGQFIDRKQAESRLRESEHRHRLLSELTSDFTYIGRVDEGGQVGIEYISEGFFSITGYTEEEIAALSWRDLVPQEDVAYHLECLRHLIAGERLADEIRVLSKAGEVRWLKHLSIPVWDEQEGRTARIVGAVQDVTEKRLGEANLRESELRFRQLAEHINDVFWIRDPSQSRPLYVSPAYQSLFGGPAETYEDRNRFIATVLPEDRERVFEADRAQAEGQATAIEYRIRRSDGNVRWIWDRGFPIHDSQGTLLRIVGIAEDITPRKNIEQALLESEERFRAIFNQVNVGIAETDLSGKFMLVNDRFCEIVGYSQAELLELRYEEVTHPDDLARNAELFDQLGQGQNYIIEKRYVRKDGSPVWVRNAVAVMRDRWENPVFAVAVVQDISDTKRLEEELRRRVSELADADRRKDEFLAMLAHELRNPLAPIRNGLELMKLSGLGTPELSWMRDVMERQTTQMSRLVDDLLDVSRITRGKIALRNETVDLAALIERVAESSRAMTSEREQQLTVNLPSEPLVIAGDPTRLEQIVANLLHNASKYSDVGAKITVSCRRERDGRAAIEVADTGIGISPEMLPRIFDLFVQVKDHQDRSVGGLGIGLTLVHRLVQLHGGTIEAHSAGLGQGSRFVVTLPVKLPQDVASADGNGHAPHRNGPERQILVVDDNLDAALTLAHLLKAEGHRVQVAHDGASALALADAQLDAVLLDLGMPGMDGFEVARRMRQRPELNRVILIALTGWGQEEDRRKSQEAGFNLHLVKPVEPDALKRVLAALDRPLSESQA